MSRLTLTRPLVFVIVAILMVTVLGEAWMGRLPLGPDGQFGWLAADIWSSSQSQRVLDPYSISHVLHGFLFYLVLWRVAGTRPVGVRLVAAIFLEAVWELLENSPLVIDRYRAVTIAQGYVGDSILNSISDIFMAALGFLIAWRLRPRTTVGLFVVAELLMLLFIRDNLTLNILMLLAPVESIRLWQMAGH